MPIVKSEELKALETSELRFRRLFETARDGILLVAADTGIIIAANPFICELLSRTNESVVGTHLWDLGPLKDIVSSQAKFLELQINFDAPIAEIVHQHHERLDGSGYPNGLVGDQILLEAQVIAVADTIEAMSSHRPYRAGLGIDAALKEVSDHVDTRYNSLAVSAALRLFQEQDFRFQEI